MNSMPPPKTTNVLKPFARSLQVAFEDRGERLLVLPLRVLWREHLDAVEDEQGLEIHRLLSPERSVVVERGDPLRLGHEVLAAGHRHALHEAHDGLLRGGGTSYFTPSTSYISDMCTCPLNTT